MLNNASGFKHIYLCTGYTDLRRGIDGLIAVLNAEFKLDPTESDSIFLFCGRRCDRIKALLTFIRIFTSFFFTNKKGVRFYSCS